MRVLLLSRYGRLGASSRLRSLQYLPFLEAHGVEVTVAPFFSDDYLKALYESGKRPFTNMLAAFSGRVRALLHCQKYDLVWLEKEIFPWLPGFAEFIISKTVVPYAADYDDAYFHKYEGNNSAIVRFVLGNKIDRIMQRSALVIAGNEYLADRARQAGAREVAVLPTVIDLDRYTAQPRKDEGVFTVGWIGSPSTQKYLSSIGPALAEACNGRDARLVLVGSEKVDLGKLEAEIYPWSECSEVQHIYSFDVGIMPLPDEPWERGKCGYKLIQYMACGKPVVASPVGVNKELVRHGWNGFLANTHKDWVWSLNVLRSSSELRKDMGKRGRESVEQKYCLQFTAPILLNLLKNVAASVE